MNLLLAVTSVSGNGLVSFAFQVLIIGLCLLIVWALGRWIIGKLAAPPMVMTVWSGLFILIGAIVLIDFLMGLAGHPFVTFW